MIKYITILMFSICLSSCSEHNENYYLKHPSSMQQALDKCPEQSPLSMSCEQLANTAYRINTYVIKLRSNPQQFGKEILILQEKIAEQDKSLQDNYDQPELKESLRADKKELRQRMAVVRWLESPGR
jgi:hypothetical protein